MSRLPNWNSASKWPMRLGMIGLFAVLVGVGFWIWAHEACNIEVFESIRLDEVYSTGNCLAPLSSAAQALSLTGAAAECSIC